MFQELVNLFMRKLKTLLQCRWLFILLFGIAILFSLIYTNFFPFSSKYQQNDTKFKGIVTKYKIDGDKFTIYLKAKEKLIVNYYFSTHIEKKWYEKNLQLGDYLEITGKLEKPKSPTIPNQFHYRNYLYRQKIYYLVSASNIRKVKNNISVLYYFKNLITKRIDQIDQTGYLRTFLLGDKTILDEEMKLYYQQNGISHLFSISGMHVSLIVTCILFILKKVSYNRWYQYIVLILVLLFYLFLADFSASIVRTTILFILGSINQCFALKIKKVDIMLLTLVVAVIFNPFILYDVGFQFSYVISFSLILLNSKINKIQSKFLKALYMSFVCFIVSFPICIYHFHQVNFLSIFFNIVMIPFVSTIVFPFSLIVFIFPIFSSIYQFIIQLLEVLNTCFHYVTVCEVVFCKVPIAVLFLYYGILVLVFFQKKYFWCFLILLLLHKFYPYFDGNLTLTVLDVGQGDAIFVKFPHNQGNILIDTGGILPLSKEKWRIRKKEYSIVLDRIIPYLKSIGVAEIDTLILTHGDFDHMGEASTLVYNFKVKEVIFNCGEFNDLETKFIKILKQRKVKYYSCMQQLNINGNQLYFLNTKQYHDENENSNVIYFLLYHYKFLLMGDAGEIREKDILEKYDLKSVNFLKVGHHGSDTSSSKEFINSINPKYSLISVGENNRYGHPKEKVLNNLKNSKIYRTDRDGSIEFKLNKNRCEIRTCLP